MSQDSAARYYQKNKEKPQKNTCDRSQCLCEEEIEKKQWYGLHVSLNMKNKSLLIMEKNIIKYGKIRLLHK